MQTTGEDIKEALATLRRARNDVAERLAAAPAWHALAQLVEREAAGQALETLPGPELRKSLEDKVAAAVPDWRWLEELEAAIGAITSAAAIAGPFGATANSGNGSEATKTSGHPATPATGQSLQAVSDSGIGGTTGNATGGGIGQAGESRLTPSSSADDAASDHGGQGRPRKRSLIAALGELQALGQGEESTVDAAAALKRIRSIARPGREDAVVVHGERMPGSGYPAGPDPADGSRIGEAEPSALHDQREANAEQSGHSRRAGQSAGRERAEATEPSNANQPPMPAGSDSARRMAWLEQEVDNLTSLDRRMTSQRGSPPVRGFAATAIEDAEHGMVLPSDIDEAEVEIVNTTPTRTEELEQARLADRMGQRPLTMRPSTAEEADGEQEDGLDGLQYAAYRDFVDEASVEIVLLDPADSGNDEPTAEDRAKKGPSGGTVGLARGN